MEVAWPHCVPHGTEAARLRVDRRRCRSCRLNGGAAAQPKSGETAAQPKKIVVLHSDDRNFEPGATWGRESAMN